MAPRQLMHRHFRRTEQWRQSDRMESAPVRRKTLHTRSGPRTADWDVRKEWRYLGGGAGVKISRRLGSGFGFGFGAFLVSLRPLSLFPM